MPKLRGPLLSLGATGGLAKLLSLVRRRRQNIIEKKPIPTDAKSPVQLFYRHMFSKCVDLWHTLSEAEKQEWESLARPRHMTGYAWFISQCLRPNPGIYLPLQGGTMQGDIDMDSNRILDLLDPTVDQEAATKKYHDDNLPPGGYTEGARAYHSAHQSIPDATLFILAFDSERYDTDTIHDPVTNNSRLTCKTAGKYIISANVVFAWSAPGTRIALLLLNATTFIGSFSVRAADAGTTNLAVSTIYDLAVNDFIEVEVWQNSGGPLDVRVEGNHSPEFMMQRIG